MSSGSSGALLSPQFRRRLKSARRLLYPAGLRFAEAWAGRLSDSQCQRFGKWLGSLAYWTLFPERRRTHRHLRMALGPSLPPPRIRQIAIGSFQNLALNGLECLRFRTLGPELLLKGIRAVGWEHVLDAERAGRGGIFVTGHIGNWELSAVYVVLRGHCMNVVARRIYLDALNRRLVEMRAAMGVNTLYRDESMRAMIRCLQANEFLGILPDQDVRRVGGIFTQFFGSQARTPVGPALLAMASGAPLLLARDIREGSRHTIAVDPPIYANRDAPRDEEVRRLVTLYTQRLEAFIREHPDQWVWMHRRWRTRPPRSLT